MRIAVDGRCLQSERRGMGVYTEGLLSAFARLGARDDITIILDRSLPDPDEVAFYPALRTGGPGGIIAWEQVYLPMAARGFDLLHAPANGAPLLSPCPVVLTMHDAIFIRRLRDISEVTYARQALGHYYRRYMYPVAARRAREVITVSDFCRNEINALTGIPLSRITAIHEAVSDAFLRCSPVQEEIVRGRLGSEGPYLLAMGAYEKRKNIPFLFEVMEVLRRRLGNPPTLVLAGAENLKATRYREEVRERGITELVRFLPYLDEPELKGLFTWATVFLWPSVKEGFGLPPLEAMCCDTPVIASDIPVNHEIAGDGALLLDPGNSAAWAEAIVSILTEEEEARKLRERGRQRVGRFSWDRAADATRAVYERALAVS